MSQQPGWFTEAHQASGSSIGFRTEQLLHSEQSAFQTIDIYQTTDWGNLMVIDGCVMLTARDNFFYHEMMTHPALFTHARAKRVVIIGGGDCGTLREVLRHDEVEHVVQVEIDERVTRLAEQYFPELCQDNGDPRAELLFADGIKYLAEATAESLDLIVVDSTDPVGPAAGLFNATFYTSCYKALRHGGLLVQQSESPLVHLELIKSMRAAMHSAGFSARRTLPFPQPCYPTGWWSCTMARKGGSCLNFASAAPSARTSRRATTTRRSTRRRWPSPSSCARRLASSGFTQLPRLPSAVVQARQPILRSPCSGRINTMRGSRAFHLCCLLTGALVLLLADDVWAHSRADEPPQRASAADFEQDQALLAFQRDLVSVLALRADPQPLLAAALLARPLSAQPKPLSFHALIERAATAPGAGPATNWVRLADCDPAPGKCPNAAARDVLLQQAPGNAAVWLLKLGSDVRTHDSQAARQDLAKAAAANLYDDYAGASLQALAFSVGMLPPPPATRNPAYAAGATATQVMLVFGLAHTLPQPALQVAAKFCENATADRGVRSDCLELGKTLEWGSSPLARSLGLHLRETLAADQARQTDAAQARINLAWQVKQFAELNARALNDKGLAQHLLALARNGGTEMSLMLAALRDQHIDLEAPPGWSPSAESGNSQARAQ